MLVISCRKVLREAASGGRDAERVKLKLEIKVEVRKYLDIQHHSVVKGKFNILVDCLIHFIVLVLNASKIN